MNQFSRRPKRHNYGMWLGPLLTFVAVVSYYFPPIVQIPFLRDFPWLNLPLALLGVGLAGLGLRRAWATGRRIGTATAAAGLLLSLVLAGLFCTYVFGLSYQMPAENETLLGSEWPELTLPDHLGRPTTLTDMRGSKAVLVFFRGHW